MSSYVTDRHHIPVTVIIPTIEERREKLEQCLYSISESTYLPAQILTSTDVMGAGPAVLRNHMSVMAQNDWIAFIDDDDLVLPNHFETLWKAREDEDLKLSYDVIYSRPQTVGRKPIDVRPFDGQALMEKNYIPVTTLVNKEAFRRVGGFPEDQAYEDWGLWKKMLKKRARFRFVDEVTWVYRYFPGCRTDQNNKR